MSQYKTDTSKTYNTIFCDTKYQVLFWENIKICHFFLLLSVSDHFKTIVPLCVRVYPFNDMKLSISQWNQLKIEIMSWESDMKPSISQWNRWKIEIMFWENNMKPSIWYRKISFYDRFHSNFHKKRISISNSNQYFLRIVIFILYRIISILNHILLVSCTDFAILPMPAQHQVGRSVGQNF